MNYRSCLLAGVLTILLACQATAQEPTTGLEPVETVVRKKGTVVPKRSTFEIVPCTLLDTKCEAGWFRFERPSLDRMLTITQSEQRCRREQLASLREPDGWSPVVVVLVTGGIVITVSAAAFVVGYFVGK